MRVLAVHNFYQQPGGEDEVFAAETRMLKNAGHEVRTLTETNDRVSGMGKFALAQATIWNGEAYRRVYKLVGDFRPDVVHFHNIFPLLSPASYYAARKAGAAVVQTLHNYRLLCPAATLLRDGKPCEDCVGKLVPWPGVQHACYRESRVASAGVAAMLTAHRAARTWRREVDMFIALTEFSKSKFVKGGLPADRIAVKPNFMESDPGMGVGGDAVVYAGRLSAEKGLDILIEAWRANSGLPPLKVIGDGPLGPWLKDAIASMPQVEWLGRLRHEQVVEEFQHARAVILPSVCYESFPLVVAEAFAAGAPMVVSDAGTLPELVREGCTGFVFQSGNKDELASKVRRLMDSREWQRLHEGSRAEYQRLYHAERNCEMLLGIYNSALRNREGVKITT